MALALAAALLVAAPLYAGLRALGLPGALVALLVPGAVALGRRLPAIRARPAVVALVTLPVLIAAVQLTRLTAFMLDAKARQHSMLPHDTFVRHSCLSAYHRADQLARWGEPDIYRSALYRGSQGPFQQEAFEYPAPFLLLPRALEAVTHHDFNRLRPLWFAGMTLLLLGALAAAARWAGGPALALAPALLASMPTLLALQYGNFHLAAVALAVLGMMALEDRAPLGGALLAFAIWAKLFPAFLLIPLVIQRRRHALFWTISWLLIWPLLAVVVLGPAPTTAFFAHQLGDVASGAAFPFIDGNERVVAANLSAYGLILKVCRLVGAAPPPSTIISVIYALLVALGIARTTPTAPERRASMRLWLAALFLGALASPFAPFPYAAFAGLWLLTFLVPGGPPSALVAAWLCLSVMVFALPLHAGPALLGLSLGAQLVSLTVVVVQVGPWRQPSSSSTDVPPSTWPAPPAG
jgi:hypothetical protein